MFFCSAVISVTLRVNVSVGGKCSVWGGVVADTSPFVTALLPRSSLRRHSSSQVIVIISAKWGKVRTKQWDFILFRSVLKRISFNFMTCSQMFMFMAREAERLRQSRVVQSVTWDGDKIEEHTGTHIQWRFWSLLVANLIRICLDFQNASHIIWLCMK